MDVIHWELLSNGTMITSQTYCQQLDRVAEKLDGKQPIFFLHDNARPHVATLTRQKLADLGWTVFPQPPYSPDWPHWFSFVPLVVEPFSEKEIRQRRRNSIGIRYVWKPKPREFYESGILALKSRWQRVIERNGSYFEQDSILNTRENNQNLVNNRIQRFSF